MQEEGKVEKEKEKGEKGEEEEEGRKRDRFKDKRLFNNIA